jgi:hypothetical protein
MLAPLAAKTLVVRKRARLLIGFGVRSTATRTSASTPATS